VSSVDNETDIVVFSNSKGNWHKKVRDSRIAIKLQKILFIVVARFISAIPIGRLFHYTKIQ
jgi:hypothetical protein